MGISRRTQKIMARHYDDVECYNRAVKFGMPEAAKKWNHRLTASAQEVIESNRQDQVDRERQQREEERRQREERGRGFNWFGN
ncbi:hypothetical protein ACH4GG_24510 [Streptomyces albidoflavus]|uniref:hypothetical protein n=1 Tax=Streptomyces albidoflavus TaxID=1886 RepID=UPI0004C83862|nr:hypothetical protein [Streptomyces albidoflavus]RZE28403.1 hypothetical protein C0Q96_13335 [Streptomyces albidoflavus]WTC32042.1 hypothetical protein OH749_23755 [Streptomyces albidoflavus]